MSEVEDWIGKAEDDLDAAETLIEGDNLDQAMFHLQQMVEKALKALILEREGDYPYIHDLVELAGKVDLPEKYLDAFSELNPVYYSTRYPDSTEDKIENFEEIKSSVEEFFEWTKNN